MRKLSYLIARNLLLFVKNKKNVCLCFFSIFVVLGLYVIFLRDFIISSVAENGLWGVLGKEFTDRLMLSGLLVVLNTTTTFGIMQTAVGDTCSGVVKDFLIAPVSEMLIITGYWASAVIVSFFFTSLTFGACEVYFLLQYQAPLAFQQSIFAIGIILTCSVINSGIMMCFIQFIKDTTSFSTFGNLYGMMIGFLAGTYLPYQLYPEKLKSVLFYFPPTQLTCILRNCCLKPISESLIQSKQGELTAMLSRIYGVTLLKNGAEITIRQQWSILCYAMAAILAVLSIVTAIKNKR